jgi:hypothetical protein
MVTASADVGLESGKKRAGQEQLEGESPKKNGKASA